MVNAQYIHFDDATNRLIAVFDKSATLDDVRPLAQQLAEMPGTIIMMVPGRMDDGPRVPLLFMTLQHLANVNAAVSRMKELTRPRLSITLSSLTFTLLLCDCNYVTSSTKMQFLNGLHPDDQELFWLKYHASIKKLDVASAITDPPYTLLTDALTELLRELGAHASTISINPERDTRTCEHPK